MSTIYGFNQEKDIDRVLRMLDSFERSKGKSVIGPSNVRTEARYAKILTVFNNSTNEDNDDKEATGVEVIWDKDNYDFIAIPEEDKPVMYDDELLKGDEATVFSTNNIVSKSTMAVDDIVLLQKYPNITETAGWLVVEAGGGAGNGRHYVTITAAADAANYTGNVITSPLDSTVIKEGVSIQIPNAVGTPIEIGTNSWADFSAADDIYYLDKILAR